MYRISNDQRSKQSMMRITNAVITLGQHIPFQELTVTQLVDEAKIGRTTFYRYFETVEDVVQYLCDVCLDDFIVQMNHVNFSHQSNPLASFIGPYLNYFKQHDQFVKLLITGDRLDMIKPKLRLIAQKSVINMDEHVRSYFIEMKLAFAITLLTEYFKTDQPINVEVLTANLSSEIKKFIN